MPLAFRWGGATLADRALHADGPRQPEGPAVLHLEFRQGFKRKILEFPGIAGILGFYNVCGHQGG